MPNRRRPIGVDRAVWRARCSVLVPSNFERRGSTEPTSRRHNLYQLIQTMSPAVERPGCHSLWRSAGRRAEAELGSRIRRAKTRGGDRSAPTSRAHRKREHAPVVQPPCSVARSDCPLRTDPRSDGTKFAVKKRKAERASAATLPSSRPSGSDSEGRMRDGVNALRRCCPSVSTVAATAAISADGFSNVGEGGRGPRPKPRNKAIATATPASPAAHSGKVRRAGVRAGSEARRTAATSRCSNPADAAGVAPRAACRSWFSSAAMAWSLSRQAGQWARCPDAGTWGVDGAGESVSADHRRMMRQTQCGDSFDEVFMA